VSLLFLIVAAVASISLTSDYRTDGRMFFGPGVR
jgi:hypothetical protein